MKTFGNKSLSAILATLTNVLWWIEWISSGILITGIIVTFFVKSDMRLTVPVTFSSVTFKQVNAVDNSTAVGALNVMNGNFSFPINNNLANAFVLLIAIASVCAVVIIVTYNLKLIFSSLRNNQPFHQLNIIRIKRIGIVLIIFSVAQFLLNIFLNTFLNAHFKWGPEIALTYTFKISYLVTGIILIIVSEIFKLGESLEEETNLTI